MNPIHPKKVVILLLVIKALLLLVIFIGCENEFFKFPKLSSFISMHREKIPVNKTNIYSTPQVKVEEILKSDSLELTLKKDSTQIGDKKIAVPELLPHQLLIHPTESANGLEFFYSKIKKLKDEKKPVRVVHFGDSQIEGDRISSVIRENLQKIFGGCGVGFLPISENNFARKNVWREYFGWQKYQAFGAKVDGEHNGYGITGYYHKKSTDQTEAWIKFKCNKNIYSKVRQVEVLNLLYGNLKGESFYELKNKQGKIAEGILNPVNKVSMESWDLNDYRNNEFQLSIKGASSPDVYGISLDCKEGMALDNISMRGSSGVDFTKMNKELLKEQFNHLNVGLIIYQFGVNIIPHEVGNYKYYENLVYAQLMLLKSIIPDVSIIVVSVSDMAKKNENEFLSYPNIPLVKQAQMNAAKRANCVFWDLHAVMGGENSIKSWVESQPALAEKDYTHFTPKGSAWVGRKLFEAILFDYLKSNTK